MTKAIRAGLYLATIPAFLTSAAAMAAPVPETTWTEDASRDYYNAALNLAWQNKLGDWIDATGARQGSKAFATATLTDTNSEKTVQWDVTALVQKYGADFLIRRSGGTNALFHSTEAASGKRPTLVITRGGSTTTLQATDDTWLSSSTYQSQGTQTTLNTAGNMLVKFNQGADSTVTKAVLKMVATPSQYGTQTLSVYKTDAHPYSLTAPSVAMGTNADVVLRLKGANWKTTSFGMFRSDRNVVNADGSMTVTIPTGGDLGSDAGYTIPRSGRRETMFARTIMKVHTNWDATMGGKYPGLANTGQGDRASNAAGWGGRMANGVRWSARTNRDGTVLGTPYAMTHQGLSPYIYRINRTTTHGEGTFFNKPIEKGKAFVLDQMIKLNTPGQANGEVAYWINGQLVGRMTGIVWRNRTGDDTLPSEYWADVYEGGVGYVAKHPHSVTLYEVAVSTKLLPFDKAALDKINASN